jgi:hypothetical protein
VMGTDGMRLSQGRLRKQSGGAGGERETVRDTQHQMTPLFHV